MRPAICFGMAIGPGEAACILSQTRDRDDPRVGLLLLEYAPYVGAARRSGGAVRARIWCMTWSTAAVMALIRPTLVPP